MDTGPPGTERWEADVAARDLTARAGHTIEHSRRLQALGAASPPSGDVKVTHMMPTSGPVFGSTKVSIFGSDFSQQGNYALTFSSAHFAKTTTHFECASSSSVPGPPAGSCEVLVFAVPIWGASFDLLYAAVETEVVLYSNLAPVYVKNTTTNETSLLSFLYEPAWEPGSLSPATAGPVIGGTGKTSLCMYGRA